MEEYNLIKKKYNNGLIFKLSQIGYGLYSTLLFTRRISEMQDASLNLISNLQNRQSVFISFWNNESKLNLQDFIDVLKKKDIKLEFYLMDEPNVNSNIISYLLPYSTHIFCQNNIYDHPQVHCMPIGIRDCGNVVIGHEGFTHNILCNQKSQDHEKNILCLLCFTLNHDDNNDERYRCYNILNKEQFILNLNNEKYDNTNPLFCGKIPLEINYLYLHKSYYVLCPKGAGEDTHRFWEAIYLNTIPIVKKSHTVFDKVYNIFPCLLIDNWTQITKDFLENNLEDCTEKMRQFHIKYSNAYTDLESINELLLKT
jgi:hypothetical protein